MNKGKHFCHHVWRWEREATIDEMTKYRRTSVYYCIKCGKEKPGGLFLPPGPIDFDELKRNKKF